VPSGLVAAYAFNEGMGTMTADASGLGHTGAISGASWTTAGRFGGALAFDGQNDVVTVNDTAALDLTTAMTFEAWVYPTTTPSGWRQVVGKDGTSQVVYYLHASSSPNNRPATGGFANGQYFDLFGTTTLTINVWTHLAATYNGATQRLYVNGVEVANRAQTGGTLVTTGPLRIGGNGVSTEFFAGRIDDVRVYNRALTQAEIQADMARAVAP
jgi:hypothetical protein